MTRPRSTGHGVDRTNRKLIRRRWSSAYLRLHESRIRANLIGFKRRTKRGGHLVPVKLLVFCDDLYHPGATVRTGLAPLAAAGFEFDWVEDASNWAATSLEAYPAALLSKSNVCTPTDKTPWLGPGTESAFLDHVRRGGGLVVIHSGTASYADVAPVRAVTGGTFLSHPPPCAISMMPKVGHPLTVGVPEPFVIRDEHYQMALDDAHADVFLRSVSEHGEQPAGWTRSEGAGRVCVLTPGHFPKVWLHPSFQQLIVNALHWVTHSLN